MKTIDSDSQNSCEKVIWTEIAGSQQSDSSVVYHCKLINNSDMEQWVVLFNNPVFDVEVILKSGQYEKSCKGGLIKKGSFLNFKKRYAVSIPIVISINIPTEIFLKFKLGDYVSRSSLPELLNMDVFMSNVKMSGIIDDSLLGILIFLVLISLYFFFILHEKVFFYIACNLFFVVLQCSNILFVFDEFEHINPVFLLLTASAFYFVLILYIHIYRSIIAPLYHFTILNHFTNIAFFCSFFLLGIQVALTFFNPGVAFKYLIYFYSPLLVFTIFTGMVVIFKTRFKRIGFLATIVVIVFLLTISGICKGFYMYVPLELSACCGGILLLSEAIKSHSRKREDVPPPQEKVGTSLEPENLNDVYNVRTKPSNLLENIGSEVVLVKFQDIVCIKIENKRCCIYTSNRGVIISNRSLEYYENFFGGIFFRLNRQFLISPVGIQKIEISQDYQYIVTLACPNDDEKIKLTKSKTFLFKNWLTVVDTI